MEPQRAWLALSLGAEREYAGNVGYDDRLDTVYRYDSFVPNFRQVAEGDLLILCDRKSALRVAEVSRIVAEDKPKTLMRCPDCGIATIKARKNKRPTFKCRAGHLFEKPDKTIEACTQYAAYFDGACLPVRGDIPVQEVRRACPRFNGQLAIQVVDLERLVGKARSLRTVATALRSAPPVKLLVAQDASDEAYVPDGHDERDIIERQIRARRGQRTFREKLRRRFNDTCLVTRCNLPDLLEAAHISPYRGDKDHHPSNGLLLRADIHTLFDLELLGIEPRTLQICLHPKVKGMGYDALAGNTLACAPGQLSRDALEARWKKFQASQRFIPV
jgi:putative restriction endonuclease